MILDATAGNRAMWQHKNSEHIIYIDIEKKLKVKPTILADNTQTPFMDALFDTIFYDPPHASADHWHFGFTLKPEQQKNKKQHIPFSNTHYGWYTYKTRVALLHHIYKAEKEFMRILKQDGLLWLKWNETQTPLNNILGIFHRWDTLLCLPVNSPTHTFGKAQTYWILLHKKEVKIIQSDLNQFQLGNHSAHITL